MRKVWSKEQIKELIESAGYTIIGEIGHLNDKVECLSPDGYRVLVMPEWIKRRGDVADIVSPFNPYSIENIQKWIYNHGSNTVLLSNTYNNSRTKLLLKCVCGKEFEANWLDIHAGKKYCNYCAKSKRWDGLVDYNNLVEKECRKRGLILLPNQDITRSNTYFKYICKTHKEFGVQVCYPGNFITESGTGGCYYCGIEKRIKSQLLSDEECRKITESKGFDFIEVKDFGRNNKRKIYYKCKRCNSNNVWHTSITNMIRHSGRCPGCKSSLFEEEVENILNKYSIKYEREKRYKDCRDVYALPFDFYLTDYNVLIEADGEQHYFPVFGSTEEEKTFNYTKTVQHDNIKNQYCKENCIQLIRIPYWERSNLEKYLIYSLNNYLQL